MDKIPIKDSQSTSNIKKSIIEEIETRVELLRKKVSDKSILPIHLHNILFRIRYELGHIYGKNSEELKILDIKNDEIPINLVSEITIKYCNKIDQFLISLRQLPLIFFGNTIQNKIFIGHGRSPIWRELKDFLHERLYLEWDEFNRESVAGIPTFERLTNILNNALFAFIIMTAEDQYKDNSFHARENVIHEAGLFQGKLGSRKAIILLEDSCTEFSNIVGLTQIRFQNGDISSTFEEIRRVLEREGVI